MTFRVALTFDAEHPDRPTEPGVAETILETLERSAVRATFFVQGRWAQAYPDIARAIGQAHLVGNHSHAHSLAERLRDDGFLADTQNAEAEIRSIVGVDPRPWYRAPWGQADQRIRSLLSRIGYRDPVHWHVHATDWDRGAEQAADVEHDVVEGVLRHGDGAVVLLHTWPTGTGAALPSILGRLIADGAIFVDVSGLERLP
jgi:peptidoglycan/xylan/chitin deacetylase (PgdA/CDA1 family)